MTTRHVIQSTYPGAALFLYLFARSHLRIIVTFSFLLLLRGHKAKDLASLERMKFVASRAGLLKVMLLLLLLLLLITRITCHDRSLLYLPHGPRPSRRLCRRGEWPVTVRAHNA